MKTEIISIGDEILSGDIIDTNKSYLSDRLWQHGIKIHFHTSVRDDAFYIEHVLKQAALRSELILVTGGLGPTADDLTLEIAAIAFGKKLVLSQKALKNIKRIYSQKQKPLKPNNKKQAYVPQGAKVYENKMGTAPGVFCEYKKKKFYFFPGVPYEMKYLFETHVLNEILKHKKDKLFFVSKNLKCFGITESDIDDSMTDLYKNRMEIENVRVGFRPHFPEIIIKLSAWQSSKIKAQQLLDKAEQKIREKIGHYIYGENEDSLESVVADLMIKNKKTLSVAESCTGGLLANRITNISGASQFLKSGLVTYSNESKISLLAISPELLNQKGAVSSEVAIHMAEASRKIAASDFGIGITGIAGPSGGSKQKPVGTVHIALASRLATKEKKFEFVKDRKLFKKLVTSVALNWLRLELINN